MLELSAVIVIIGLITAVALGLKQSSAEDCYLTTKQQLNDIDAAIQRFISKMDRLPMPAARNVGVEDPLHGREASGGAIDTANGASWGALPFQALGLAPSYAADCWGNKLTYVVTTALTSNATSGGYQDSSMDGNITVRKDASTTITTTAAYAIISHGADALGSVKNNYGNPSKGWCTGAASIATQNCLASSATVASAAFNNGKDAGANFFDDVIITNGKPYVAQLTPQCIGTTYVLTATPNDVLTAQVTRQP